MCIQFLLFFSSLPSSYDSCVFVCVYLLQFLLLLFLSDSKFLCFSCDCCFVYLCRFFFLVIFLLFFLLFSLFLLSNIHFHSFATFTAHKFLFPPSFHHPRAQSDFFIALFLFALFLSLSLYASHDFLWKKEIIEKLQCHETTWI